jgi:hypothetical protein
LSENRLKTGVPTGRGGLSFPQSFLFPKIFRIKSKDDYELHDKLVSHWGSERGTGGAPVLLQAVKMVYPGGRNRGGSVDGGVVGAVGTKNIPWW